MNKVDEVSPEPPGNADLGQFFETSITAKLEEIELLKQQLESERSNFTAVLKEKDEEICSISIKWKDISTENTRKTLEIAELNKCLQNKFIECAAINTQLSSVTRELNQRRALLDAHTYELRGLRADLQTANETIAAQTNALEELKKTTESQKQELENQAAAKISDLKRTLDSQKLELDRHAGVAAKKRELDLVKAFLHTFKTHNFGKKIPDYVHFLINDYICNVCLDELSKRPLMVSKVAFQAGKTHLDLEDLKKIGLIASDIYKSQYGNRPPKSTRCAGGNMNIDVNIYDEQDRWILESAIDQHCA